MFSNHTSLLHVIRPPFVSDIEFASRVIVRAPAHGEGMRCLTFCSAVLELTHYFRGARRSGTVLLLAGEDTKTLLLPLG
jgi:hypothetical protein